MNTYLLLLFVALSLPLQAHTQDVEDEAHPSAEPATLAPETTEETSPEPALGAVTGTPPARAIDAETPVVEAPPEEPQPVVRLGGAWEQHLPNGLHLVGREDARHERSALCVSYGAGSLYDPRGFEGLALLTQRLHYNGFTPRFPHGIQTSFPLIDAQLYRNSSVHCIQVLDGELERALHAESARMAYLLHSLTAEHVRAEQENYLQQGWRQSLFIPEVEQALHGRVRQSATQEGLQAIELQHVQRFHQRHYTPANAIVAIVSKRPRAEVLALAQRYFGGIPGSPATPRPSLQQRTPMTRSVQIDVAGPVPRGVSVFWRSPAHLSDGDVALDLVAAYLRRALRRQLGANAIHVSVEQFSRSDYSEFSVLVQTVDGVDLNALARQVNAAVHEVGEAPLSDVALQAARNSFVWRSPNPEARAAALASNSRQAGVLFPYEARLSRVDALSADDVRQAAFRFLRGNSVTVFSEHSRRPRPAVVRRAL